MCELPAFVSEIYIINTVTPVLPETLTQAQSTVLDLASAEGSPAVAVIVFLDSVFFLRRSMESTM